MQPTTKDISKWFLSVLKPFGIFVWHTSKFDSIYLKFRDARLGSIRIADHPGRDFYSYKYEVFQDTATQAQLDVIVDDIVAKAHKLCYPYFDPTKFITWSNDAHSYIEVPDLAAYRESILHKGK